MSVHLSERVMSATDLKRMELLSYLQHIVNNPHMYEDAEGQIAALHVQLRSMNEWAALAKEAGVEL